MDANKYGTWQEKIFASFANKPKTNADRIRSMTDEELAKWLDDVCNPYLDSIETGRWLEWLKQEDE